MHATRRTAIRNQFAGLSFADGITGQLANKVLKSLDFAEHTKKDEVRKNGAPGISHEYDGIAVIMSLTLPINERLILSNLYALHDLHEDYNIQQTDVAWLTTEEFSRVILISKVHNGIKMDTSDYYSQMTADPFVMIAKGIDRYVNLSSMSGFKSEKIMAQISETNVYVIPLIKNLRKYSADYRAVYELLKTIIRNQMETLAVVAKIQDQQ